MQHTKSRLHMHNHNEPQGRAYIVGERAALRALGEKLIAGSNSLLGFETLTLYTSDGHPYEIFITSNVSEDEWQQLPVPYDKNHNPDSLEIVGVYDKLNDH